MTETRLRDLERCFRGVIPGTVASCSPEGVPNITYLSVVHRVDDEHVALSFQFFNKTRENILRQPRAQLLVVDPGTMVQYRLDVLYLRTEEAGPIFERMRTNLDAVASQTGMSGVFRLRGADIYRVLRIEALAHDLDLSEPQAPADLVGALATLSDRLAACDELDALLDTLLDGLAELFDHRASMILLADEAGARLYTVASRGFASSGVGAEIAVGEGLIGTAALHRQPVRTVNLRRDLIMAQAVRSTALAQGQSVVASREIPLPGLPDMLSQLAVPILARDRLLGVLCVQSAEAGRLTPVDEQVLGTLARYLATSMLLVQSSAAEPAAGRSYERRPAAGPTLRARHHASDDSIFLDDEYLIKGLPGRILLRVLDVYQRDGRVDFSNKELRVDADLHLPGYRDNLEARLILLRRRLEERTDALRLEKTGRGRFRLALARPLELVRAR